MAAEAFLTLDLQGEHVSVGSAPDLGQHRGQIQTRALDRRVGIVLHAGDQPGSGQVWKRAPRESLVVGPFSYTH